MKYISAKTVNGNVAYSYISQEDAETLAQAMDTNCNVNCVDCRGCTHCTNCVSCNDCFKCRNCSFCRDCFEGDNLRACVDLSHISGAANLYTGLWHHVSAAEQIASLDKVREVVMTNSARLDMRYWHRGPLAADGTLDYVTSMLWEQRTPEEEVHTCGTAHCIAGWLQVFGGPSARHNWVTTAAVSIAPGAGFMFHRSQEEALEWLTDRTYADQIKD